MRILNNLDRLMWERKLTATKLAELSGVSATKISMIRNNPAENITKETMEKLCSALEVELHELLHIERKSLAPAA